VLRQVRFMGLPSYYDYRSREKKESRLAEYIDYKPKEDFLNTDDLELYMKAYKARHDENERLSKLTPLESLEYYERMNEDMDNLINPKETKEFIENEQANNNLFHLILENRLGFQLPIKSDLIEDYLITVRDKSQYECDYFIIIMKFEDIEQLEEGAMEFLKKAQIFNVYLIYEDNRREKIAVPWNNDYMDMINKYQEVTIGQDEIIMKISKNKV
jgi:hypothetical protein